MIQVTCWVEALTLYTRNLKVVGLTTYELTSLVDVSSVIWTISPEWHPQGWDH